MMDNFEARIADGSLCGKTFESLGQKFTLAKFDNFEYIDPIDKSVTKKQVGNHKI